MILVLMSSNPTIRLYNIDTTMDFSGIYFVSEENNKTARYLGPSLFMYILAEEGIYLRRKKIRGDQVRVEYLRAIRFAFISSWQN